MINSFPQITYIYNRYRKDTSIHKASIEMRISFNGRQKYISTGIMLREHQWQNGYVVRTPDATILNQKLDRMMFDVKSILLEMDNNGCIDIFAVPSKLRRLEASRMSFLDFCKQRAEIRKYGKSKDSKYRYDRFIRLFSKWGKIKEFEDVTEANIILYDKHLSKNLKANSKWYNYHRFINSFILDAINEGLLIRNPYKKLNINKGEESCGLERCLTPLELHKVKKAEMPTECIERVRDLFIFQTYTCLSYSDLRNFDASKIQEIKDSKVYIGKRGKTGIKYTIPLLPAALRILDKYKNKLPIISNVKYNEYLKVMAQAAGINKPISSHWARHTGATMLLNEGVPMEIVSKICGHSSIRMTEKVYAKLLDETVVEAVKGLDGRVG